MNLLLQTAGMSLISTIGLAGLQSSLKQAETRSKNIANAFTPGYKAARPLQVSSSYGPATIVDIGPSQESAGAAASPASTPDSASSLDLKGNDVSLAEEIVGLKQSEVSYKLSAHLINVDGELTDELLNILA